MDERLFHQEKINRLASSIYNHGNPLAETEQPEDDDLSMEELPQNRAQSYNQCHLPIAFVLGAMIYKADGPIFESGTNQEEAVERLQDIFTYLYECPRVSFSKKRAEGARWTPKKTLTERFVKRLLTEYKEIADGDMEKFKNRIPDIFSIMDESQDAFDRQFG